MMVRRACLVTLLVWAVAADSAFDCKPTVDGKQYDLSFWPQYQTIESVDSTPPTTTKIKYQVALCQALSHDGGLSDADQCPGGTRICRTVINSRDDKDRITSVVPLAGEIGHGNLEAQVSLGTVTDSSKPAPLVIKFKGGSYAGRDKRAEVTLVCDPDANEIKTVDHHYLPSEGVFTVTFATSHLCATSEPGGDGKDKSPPGTPPDPNPPQPPATKKGWGFFRTLFTLALVGILAYFIIGAYVQRTQYGATGWDLIPHRDFWRDLPFVLRDMVATRSRSGYNSLQ